MKTSKRFFLTLLPFLMLVSCGGTSNNTSTDHGDASTKTSSVIDQGSGTVSPTDSGTVAKKVTAIKVETMPNKTEYVVGETFSVEGGTIRVTYEDGSYDIISMTADGVEVSEPIMTSAATKNITVKYGGKKTTFKITVSTAKWNVSFNLNYEGAPEGETQSISNKATVEKPSDPVRTGYTFVAWYPTTDYIEQYDFDSEVTADLTLYAFWTQDGVEYHDVTFDYNFYGDRLTSYSYPVANNTPVSQPNHSPVRTGYSFNGWFDSAEGGNAYSFDSAVSADKTIYAQWTKTVTGFNDYRFEAEDTSLKGKIGKSYSGTANEEGMIVYNADVGASNNRYVSFLYKSGLSLEFYIASDMAASGAELKVYITGEYTTMSYTSDEFQVILNGTILSYPEVTIEIASHDEVAQVAPRIDISNLQLQKGSNLIQLKVNNNKAVEGTTFEAHAPMVDCIDVNTDAVLTWDGTESDTLPGLPKSNY